MFKKVMQIIFYFFVSIFLLFIFLISLENQKLEKEILVQQNILLEKVEDIQELKEQDVEIAQMLEEQKVLSGKLQQLFNGINQINKNVAMLFENYDELSKKINDEKRKKSVQENYAQSLQEEADLLFEDGKYAEALAKYETILTISYSHQNAHRKIVCEYQVNQNKTSKYQVILKEIKELKQSGYESKDLDLLEKKLSEEIM